MSRAINIPIEILKGRWASGDPSLMPEGYCLECRNVVVRPNRLETRPPFVYDSLMNVRGVAIFDDPTNKVARLIAINSSQALFEKGTSGDTWSASLGTLTGTRLSEFTNYRGKMYGMMDNGAGAPTAAFSFDGTTLTTSPFNSAIQGRCVTAYLDRLFIAYPRVTTSPLNSLASVYSTDLIGGPFANITIGSTTSGTSTLTRAFFTSIATVPSYTTSSLSFGTPLSQETQYVARIDLRNSDPVNDLPVKIQIYVSGSSTYADIRASLRNTAVTVGDFGGSSLSGSPTKTFRCTQSGTTAAVAPSFNVNLGATVVDGTAIWKAESVFTAFVKEFTLPNATALNGWTTTYVPFSVPWSTNQLYSQTTVDFGNTAVPLPTALTTVDIGLKDGLADGNAAKKNYGFQITKGDFYYPFINTETATSSTNDLKAIIWSDVLQPKSIRASATYELQETVGYPTAATTLAGRYLAFTRNAIWTFIGNADATTLDVIPIRRERVLKGVGCLGPKALDQLEDTLYFIGEDGVYRTGIGDESPDEIGGDAMREEIMARGTSWVESQATYNMPLLRIDKRNRDVWVYTQKGKIYVYHIQTGAWTNIDVANNAEIADFYFNANTRKMYVAVGGFGLARVDWNVSPTNDTVDNTANTYTCTKEIIARPVEMFAPRVDTCVENVGVFHLATASQSGQTLTAYVSFDRGTTYPYSDQITLDTTVARNPIHLFEMAPSITLKLSHVGQAGAAVWGVSKMDLEAQIMRGEWPQVAPSGTATL